MAVINFINHSFVLITLDPSLTCSQQVNNAKAVIPFTNGTYKLISVLNQLGQQQNVTFTDHIRPHYWYAAVANCDGVTFELNYQVRNVEPLFLILTLVPIPAISK